MGVQCSVAESPIIVYLENEFTRVAKTKSKLYLHQVQQLQPPQDLPLDLRHVPSLWVLDADHDGSVTYQELVSFADFCNECHRALGALDFQGKLKAQCVVQMWAVVCEERGAEAFADWVVRLASQGEVHPTFDASPNVRFMSRDAVMALYELMKPYQMASHVDQQGFLDMLQQIGEHMNLMSLLDEELDDWVPVQVVQRWVKHFMSAYVRLFKELDLEPPPASEPAPWPDSS
mmetsp:Transcript_17406/g.38066  ORF Transcript_17406/g.38066 Transcript_17406/m.38066 type:complete len:232 (+) Transcript_17406:63-758(+)